MNAIDKFLNASCRILEIFVVILISIMSILVITNVALRFFFDSSIVVSEELSRFLFIWVVFIGAIIAMKEDSHIYVDFIRNKFPKSIQFIIKLMVNVAMMYCCYMFFLGSVDLTIYNAVDKSPVAGISLGYIYVSGAIGSAGMFIVIFLRSIQLLFNANFYFNKMNKGDN